MACVLLSVFFGVIYIEARDKTQDNVRLGNLVISRPASLLEPLATRSQVIPFTFFFFFIETMPSVLTVIAV